MPHSVATTAEASAVEQALVALGGHPGVGLAVTSVSIDDGAPSDDPKVSIEVRLDYRLDRPVCCGEPGCYLGFVGLRRSEVPAAVAAALGLERAPTVTLRVALRYPPGYLHTSFRERGTPADATLVWSPSELAPR